MSIGTKLSTVQKNNNINNKDFHVVRQNENEISDYTIEEHITVQSCLTQLNTWRIKSKPFSSHRTEYVHRAFSSPLRVFDTDLTTADPCSQAAGLQCLALRDLELVRIFNGGQPEAELISKIVTSSTSTVALYERRRSEVFQAGTRTCQRLTTSFGTSGSVLWASEAIWCFEI